MSEMDGEEDDFTSMNQSGTDPCFVSYIANKLQANFANTTAFITLNLIVLLLQHVQ